MGHRRKDAPGRNGWVFTRATQNVTTTYQAGIKVAERLPRQVPLRQIVC
jgi:hypothetical protein